MAFLSLRESVEMFGARPELLALQSQLMDRFEKQTGKRSFVPVDGGVRSHARQAKLDADSQGKYPVATAGSSFHEYGAAFDLNIVGGYDAAGYRVLADIAREIGLRPGYDFANRDEFHFELRESLSTAKAKWAALQKKNWSSASPRSLSYSRSSV